MLSESTHQQVGKRELWDGILSVLHTAGNEAIGFRKVYHSGEKTGCLPTNVALEHKILSVRRKSWKRRSIIRL